MTPRSVKEAQDRLNSLLAQAEAWAGSLADLPDSLEAVASHGPECAADLRRLRTRAASTLINIALFGAFSSGKSSLVSGLQGKLEVLDFIDRDGRPAEEFVGILPASAEPASVCPARVSPVADDGEGDASGRGLLRVRFADSGDWENVGSNPVPAVLAAYLTDWGEKANRKDEHWHRDVAEGEILLSSPKVQATLYDLPGYGSPNRGHDAIIRAAINNADCFIYVSRAGRTLSDEDLELIRVLYDHCRLGRKRVIWVLTGIDTETHTDHRRIPSWRRTVERNNEYLRANFTIDGHPDSAFIGEGFIGVSPVAEARAASGETGSPGRRTAYVDPYMDKLREVIRDIIEDQSGHRHIADIAMEVHALIGPLSSTLAKRLVEERLPVDAQAKALAENQESLRRVSSAISGARGELEKALEGRVKAASQSFHGLARRLHDELDELIRETDLHNRGKANKVHVAKTQALQAWVSAPEGPAELWEQQLDQFRKDIVAWVRDNVATSDAGSWPLGTRFDLDLLDFNISAIRKGTRPETVQLAAGVITVSSAVAAAGAYFATALGLGAVFPPAAVIAGVAGAVVVGAEVFKRAHGGTSLDKMRAEWIADLGQVAKLLQGQYETSLQEQGSRMITSTVRSLDSYRTELESVIARTRARINDPNYRLTQELVDRLEQPVNEGVGLIANLDELIAYKRP